MLPWARVFRDTCLEVQAEGGCGPAEAGDPEVQSGQGSPGHVGNRRPVCPTQHPQATSAQWSTETRLVLTEMRI